MSQFLQDITSQAEVLKSEYERYCTSHRESLVTLADWRHDAPTAPVVFVGMGSSLYAPLAITPFLNRHGVATYIQEAGELYHYGLSGIPSEATLIAVSQSGESVETKRVVEQLKGGFKIVGVTNNLESSIARGSDLILPIFAGAEAAASTKTFVASILALYLASKALLNLPLTEDVEFNHIFTDLSRLTEDLTETIGDYLEFLGGIDELHVIGRGPTLASVYHGALIMKETADSHAEGMAGGTFRHGPLELAGPGHKAVVMAPAGPTSELNINLAQELAAYGSRVLLLTDKRVPEQKNLLTIEMPQVPEDLASLVYIVPLELLAWDAARRKGWTPGIPRLITKVTTRE